MIVGGGETDRLRVLQGAPARGQVRGGVHAVRGAAAVQGLLLLPWRVPGVGWVKPPSEPRRRFRAILLQKL